VAQADISMAAQMKRKKDDKIFNRRLFIASRKARLYNKKHPVNICYRVFFLN